MLSEIHGESTLNDTSPGLVSQRPPVIESKADYTSDIKSLKQDLKIEKKTLTENSIVGHGEDASPNKSPRIKLRVITGKETPQAKVKQKLKSKKKR